MLMNVWIALFVISVIQTYYLLKGKLPEVIGPMIGFFLYVMLAYSAFNLTVPHGNNLSEYAQPELAVLAVAGIILNTVWLFTDSIEYLPFDGFRGAR